MTYFRDRRTSLAVFFTEDKNICYCFDIECLFRGLGPVHVSEEWRLFIDSLKAVLLHNGNVRSQNTCDLRVHAITCDCNKLFQPHMEYMWRPESHCFAAWATARLHKAHVFCVFGTTVRIAITILR